MAEEIPASAEKRPRNPGSDEVIPSFTPGKFQPGDVGGSSRR